LNRFRENATRLENRAVFEIPEIFAKLLGENGEGLRKRPRGKQAGN